MSAARVAAWAAVPVRWYLGVLFVGASLHKIAEPGSFALDVATYDILPLAAVNLTALVLPWLELAAGAMLLAGWRVRAASLLVTAMMLVFLAALVTALAHGLDMSCGCFASEGAEENPISRWTVVRDLFWLAMAGFVTLADRGLAGADGWLSRRGG